MDAIDSLGFDAHFGVEPLFGAVQAREGTALFEGLGDDYLGLGGGGGGVRGEGGLEVFLILRGGEVFFVGEF